MIELTNTRQWKDEPILDYIKRLRSLSLECKDRLSEASAVEMCAQGMEWDLLYVLQMSKPKTFRKLATKAHDMETTIASRRGKSSSSSDSRKNKGEFKKNRKSTKSSNKESMAVSTGEPVRISRKPKYENKKGGFSKDTKKKHPILKELQEKKYPFPDSDLSGMLYDLLENGVIELPEPKLAEEAATVTNPKYYRYHRWLVILSRNALCSRSVLCNLPKMRR